MIGNRESITCAAQSLPGFSAAPTRKGNTHECANAGIPSTVGAGNLVADTANVLGAPSIQSPLHEPLLPSAVTEAERLSTPIAFRFSRTCRPTVTESFGLAPVSPRGA